MSQTSLSWPEACIFCLPSGEKVDIHIMRDPPGGEWQQISTEVTDKNGRIAFTIPPDKALSCGMYPVKMVVR